MCFSQPKVSTPDPQPVQQAPTQQDPIVAAAGTDAQKRNRSARGAASTALTTGTESVPLLGKVILGQ